MSRDGGLRQEFRKHLPAFHWQSVETGETGRGIPDSNFCVNGVEGWIEFKKCEANAVRMRPEQIGWISKRIRFGGRVFIGVRRKSEGNTRRAPCDEIHLIDGCSVELLAESGLGALGAYYIGTGGPARWDWMSIHRILTAPR